MRNAVNSRMPWLVGYATAIILFVSCTTEYSSEHRLRDAIFAGSNEQVQDLVRSKEDAEMRIHLGSTKQYWTTPLHLACERGESAIVSTLIEMGASPVICNSSGQTPAYVITECPNEHDAVACLSVLFDHGASIEMGNIERRVTPLMHAAAMRKTAIVAELVRRGAKINAQDVAKNTALHRAVFNSTNNEESQRIVTLLLEAGADPSICNNVGESPTDRLTGQRGQRGHPSNSALLGRGKGDRHSKP